ncbi:MAG TPA: sulfide/dihydroorotate dehydrogenase-like FAD/NAD-binding protein [Syntrophaceticus sp.]|jgi:ferredoxin--NADP+ reductase|nr:sulfide/dihydroorotate dehydrogenase-like FAD/NAD-binding protein [Syntrophaceticus schinkii]MDD4261564.1 sulfide/dihydroorotate dehydrogenase-like FAD/NAD-binding protein [Syntrophaceticus schinkii]MDD4675086.1 sulfide/dihydroorotate dehydrogenase-like FAD/NAD-binding protein [Syntrophaceticus schinkii]HHY30980.1 sulfide/dihydroorotate dehydrogenase-like FAD/NAD-binding protein [Syntrophaceticus sp.]
MYRIIERKDLSSTIKLMRIAAPEIAKKAQAGQFVILRIHDHGERIPMTIADFDRAQGTITIVFQVVGKSTEELATLKEGESILNFLGPLGQPSEIKKYGKAVCIGGGVGVAPIYPIARALHEAGNQVISIIGARNEKMLFYEEEMNSVSDHFHIVTDDGSRGKQGLVTDILCDLLESGEQIDLVFAIGPVPMMRAVAELTRGHGIKTFVSLNPIMVDGTGMCGGCRVSVGETSKFACVDGPDFDAHQVDFDQLLERQKMYCQEEQDSKEHWHQCKCRG